MGITSLVCGIFSGITVTQCFASLVILFITIYWYLTKDYGKFEKKGLFGLKPEFFWGSTKDLILGTVSGMDFHHQLYDKFKGHK